MNIYLLILKIYMTTKTTKGNTKPIKRVTCKGREGT